MMSSVTVVVYYWTWRPEIARWNASSSYNARQLVPIILIYNHLIISLATNEINCVVYFAFDASKHIAIRSLFFFFILMAHVLFLVETIQSH